MRFQDLEKLSDYVRKTLKKRPKTKLLTLFKTVRSWQCVSYFGDWPLISEIINLAAELGVYFSKRQIIGTFKQTSDPILKRQRSDSELVATFASKDKLKSRLRHGN